MGSMATAPAPVKGGRGTKCASCDGLGFLFAQEAGGMDCFPCGGTGRIIDHGDDGSPPPSHYVACQPGGDIETALTFDGLLAALEAFKLQGEDVAIWRVDEDCGPRLVAVLRPGGKSGNRVVKL